VARALARLTVTRPRALADVARGWLRPQSQGSGAVARATTPKSRAEQDVAVDRWLVVGLGNPGPEYAGNRHNAGYMCADLLAVQIGLTFKRDRSRAMAANGRLRDVPVTLAKPLSFMNLAGGAVASLRAFYKLPTEQILILHDELDLPFGAIRLKLGGGDNGHNGLRSVTAALGTRDYHRLRIGIGRPPGRMDPADFVLRNFSAAERKELPDVLTRSADAVETLLTRGLAAAQNEFHPSGR
jgi:peptidyl-tRNA hydrolase, PTH1 family